MKFFDKVKEKIAEHKLKKLFKKIEIDPKGMCLAAYSAKIACGVLTKDEIISQYETDLYKYFLISSDIQENRLWTADERVLTAAAYLTFTLNCSNGASVLQNVLEELSNYF